MPDASDGRARLVPHRPRRERDPRGRAEERIEREWEAHLGSRRMRQLREVLTALREVTNPWYDADEPGTHRSA